MQTQISTLERYALSSLTTFITAFVISLGAQLATAPLTASSLGWGTLAAVGYVAVRAGIKAIVEAWYGQVGEKTPA